MEVSHGLDLRVDKNGSFQFEDLGFESLGKLEVSGLVIGDCDDETFPSSWRDRTYLNSQIDGW